MEICGCFAVHVCDCSQGDKEIHMWENALTLLFKYNPFPTAQHNATTPVYSVTSTQIDFGNPEQVSELLGHRAEVVWTS